MGGNARHAGRRADCESCSRRRHWPCSSFSDGPAELYSVEDIEATGPAGTLPVRVYRPRPGRLPAVLFLHGGGFVIGRAGYDAPLRELALASGCMILAPECRLAPEHPFPAPVDDALAVARWLE